MFFISLLQICLFSPLLGLFQWRDGSLSAYRLPSTLTDQKKKKSHHKCLTGNGGEFTYMFCIGVLQLENMQRWQFFCGGEKKTLSWCICGIKCNYQHPL